MSARLSWVWRIGVVVAGTAFASCGAPPLRGPQGRGHTVPSHVRVRTGGRIVSVPLEEYVLGSVLAEVTPLNESPATVERIYEVQAVLARTYAASHGGRHQVEGFDVCDTAHCQLYEPDRIRTSRFVAAAREAARRTSGTVLEFAHQPAETLFHADCGGHTAAADAVWGGPPVPYLLPETDNVPSATHRSWQSVFSVDELRAALNRDRRSQVGATLKAIDVTLRDGSGRAEQVLITGDQRRVLRGEDLRAIVGETLGDRAIQSTRFSVVSTGRSYVFQGTGFGHGVGLCQVGAAARARRGDSLETIFGAYFRGATLTAHQP
jgi:stage II sporulation protein D